MTEIERPLNPDPSEDCDMPVLCDRNYFTMQEIETVITYLKSAGRDLEKVRFTFFPRYDLSAAPWMLVATSDGIKE